METEGLKWPTRRRVFGKTATFQDQSCQTQLTAPFFDFLFCCGPQRPLQEERGTAASITGIFRLIYPAAVNNGAKLKLLRQQKLW